MTSKLLGRAGPAVLGRDLHAIPSHGLIFTVLFFGKCTVFRDRKRMRTCFLLPESETNHDNDNQDGNGNQNHSWVPRVGQTLCAGALAQVDLVGRVQPAGRGARAVNGSDRWKGVPDGNRERKEKLFLSYQIPFLVVVLGSGISTDG